MGSKDKPREERLAAALRENLRRRKAQERDLAEQAESDGYREAKSDDHSKP